MRVISWLLVFAAVGCGTSTAVEPSHDAQVATQVDASSATSDAARPQRDDAGASPHDGGSSGPRCTSHSTLGESSAYLESNEILGSLGRVPTRLAGTVLSVTPSTLELETRPGHVWKVTTDHVPLGFGVQAGSWVALEHNSPSGGGIFGALSVKLTLHVGDQLAFFFARNTPADEVRFTPDSLLCADSDDCGSWTRHRVRASMPGQGAVTLDEGEQQVRGDYAFWHELTVLPGDRKGQQCADWSVGDTAYAASSVKPLSLAPAACAVSIEEKDWRGSIKIQASECSFSAAQLKAGIEIPYTISVNWAGSSYLVENDAACGTQLAPGLVVTETLSDSTRSFARGDLSKCNASDQSMEIEPADYERVFTWDGRNADGAFPPGKYTLLIQVSIFTGVARAISASLPITITP